MTIEEAAEYTQLGEDIIKSLIRFGKIRLISPNEKLNKKCTCLYRDEISKWISSEANGLPIVLTAEGAAELLGLTANELMDAVKKNTIPHFNLKVSRDFMQNIRFPKERLVRWYVYNQVDEKTNQELELPIKTIPKPLGRQRRKADRSFSLETIENAFNTDLLSDATRPIEFVYFIRCGDYTKIGVSESPYARMKEFSTGNPYPLSIVALLPSKRNQSYIIESSLHRLFSDFRFCGEWFALDGVISNEFYEKYSPRIWERFGFCQIRKAQDICRE